MAAPSSRRSVRILAVLAIASACASDCPTSLCPAGFTIHIHDSAAHDLPSGTYVVDITVDDAPTPTRVTCDTEAPTNLCVTTPEGNGLRGVVTLERGHATSIELTIPTPEDAPGVHTIELAATTPAGTIHAQTFSPEFELQEPGGPDCETCLGAAPATWPLPA